MSTPRRYEKVDEHTVRVIREQITEVDLTVLFKNRDVVREDLNKRQKDIAIVEDRLTQIEEVIAEALVLGITQEVKNVTAPKSKK